ncbi:hypothetical protein FFLO_00208 [Filobasidium floriforme]|uniref:UspA domain-containing protein n=1 Tax=Filobasidium floriforme TaxID=5210 RepID=A0A8K0NVX9_9TREE|nr:uncharacterized protein HD553DRAFT_294016 [Filobasidium floriforme]KAG7580000.1 hypothetical protein FFLO_00208 [Filobasidium floriforme]KAH8087401.1 hypothetical protein HD553DRAFT_294016 [Filobasidium floriforme]
MTERPILRTSQSSPGNSPGPSPSLRPSIIQQSSYSHRTPSPHPTSPELTSPPLSPPTGAPRVSFPWVPTRQRSTSNDHEHLSMNNAGLQSAFAHRPESVHTEAGTTIGPEFGYTRKVGFETFDNPIKESALFSYTLQTKSDAYRRTRNTRVFMVAVSPDESGSEALEWLMESLIEDGDEVVAVRVIELDEGEKASKEAQEEFREEAGGLLRKVLELNDEVSDRRISVIVEYVAGKVTSTLMRLISLYRPDSLIVGTKGSRSTLQKFGAALGAPGMGSVSRYCVSHSPVPVIVVRPERKVKKTLAKRQNDPKRQKYKAMVGSEALGLRRSRSAESRERGGALSE